MQLEDTPNKQNGEMSIIFLIINSQTSYILENISLKVCLEPFTLVYDGNTNNLRKIRPRE